MARFAEHERRPGEPKRLGAPNDDAVRIAYGLYDGSRADLTFCGACAEALNPDQYNDLWRKIMRSWLREIGNETEKHVGWFPAQYANGLLVELGRTRLKDIIHG